MPGALAGLVHAGAIGSAPSTGNAGKDRSLVVAEEDGEAPGHGVDHLKVAVSVGAVSAPVVLARVLPGFVDDLRRDYPGRF